MFKIPAFRKNKEIEESEHHLPPPQDSVYYINELNQYYKKVQFGINCAIANPAYVKMGLNVIMAHHSSITAVTGYNGIYYKPSITIGNGTQIGPYNAIAAIGKIAIGEFVLFGPYVHVNDHSHGYENIHKPVMHQPVTSKGPVIIEDGCWLGFGSHILSGVTIGRNSVIGANSLVIKNIPPYCIAVGNPAKVIKRFNFKTQKWDKILEQKIEIY